MKSSRTWLYIAAIVGIALVLFNSLNRQHRNAQSHPAVGKSFDHTHVVALTGPDAVPGEVGATVDAARLAGQVVLLNIWGTWCPPCVAEAPAIDKLQQTFAGSPVRILPVSYAGTSFSELQTDTQQFMTDRRLTMPTYADPGNITLQGIEQVLGQDVGFPTTLLIDGSGVVRGIWLGYHRGAEAEMERLIRMLLADLETSADSDISVEAT